MLSALLQLNSVKYCSPDPKLFPPKVRLGKAYLIDIAWCYNLQAYACTQTAWQNLHLAPYIFLYM